MHLLESIAIRAYAAIGVNREMFDLPEVRAHALRLVRRLLVSGCDADDCICAAMEPRVAPRVGRTGAERKRNSRTERDGQADPR